MISIAAFTLWASLSHLEGAQICANGNRGPGLVILKFVAITKLQMAINDRVIILLNHSCWEFTAEGNYIEVSVLSDLHVPMTLKAVTVRLSEPDLDHFHGAEDCIKHISLKNIKLVTPSFWISKIFYCTIFIFNVFLFKNSFHFSESIEDRV